MTFLSRTKRKILLVQLARADIVHSQREIEVMLSTLKNSPFSLAQNIKIHLRALAGDIVLCSWARRFILTVPLSTQIYKWIPANLMLGVTLRWTSIPSRGE